MKKTFLFMTLSLIGVLSVWFLFRLLAFDWGIIHDFYDDIMLYCIILILYISFCTATILNKIDKKLDNNNDHDNL